jgi:hypothetical protein
VKEHGSAGFYLAGKTDAATIKGGGPNVGNVSLKRTLAGKPVQLNRQLIFIMPINLRQAAKPCGQKKKDYKMGKNDGSKSTKQGRDNDTGQYIPLQEARNRPKSATVEHVPKPGYGTAGK